jgi:hypothetical protein
METNSESKFEINKTSIDRIESIEVSALKLTVKSPAGEDFSFLKSIEIYIDGDKLSEKKLLATTMYPVRLARPYR